MQKEEITNILKGREIIYAVFSGLYLFVPDKKQLETFNNIISSLKEIAQNSENKEILESINKLEHTVVSYFKADNTKKENILDEIHKTYTRLFCLGNALPLSESVFISPEHITKQVPEDKVIQLYMQCNFNMNHTSNEPQDHLSYELMFMSYLSKGTYLQLNNNKIAEASTLVKLQRYFINNHLLNWVPVFSSMMGSYNEKYDYYKPLTIFLEGYLKEDEKYLETLEF